MVHRSQRLQQLEAELQRTAYTTMSYADALARFAALWAEARLLQPSLNADWLADLEPDFAVARALNGLPPRT